MLRYSNSEKAYLVCRKKKSKISSRLRKQKNHGKFALFSRSKDASRISPFVGSCWSASHNSGDWDTPRNQWAQRYFQHVFPALVLSRCHINAGLRAFIYGFFHPPFLFFYSNPTHLSRVSPFHTFLAKPNSIWWLGKAHSSSTLKIILIIYESIMCRIFLLPTNGVFWRKK